MSNVFRKIRRNKLKKHLGNNKIKEFYHSEYDPLWKRLQNGIIDAKKNENKKGE